MMPDPKPTFTLNELLAYLRQGDEAQDGYLTSHEWAKRLGVSYRKMMALLHEAKDKEILLASRADRARIDGIIQPVTVYAFNISERVTADGAEGMVT